MREAEIVDELSQHLQDRYDELRRGGAAEREAALASLAELDAAGPIDLERGLARVESRPPAETVAPGEPARGRAFADLAGDVRYALRTLGRSPGFAAVAVLTLALGIGANTALFSIVNAVLLHPLPYPHADELVVLHESKQNFPSGSISYPNFRDWQRDNRTFAAMAVYRSYTFGLTGLGDAERVRAEFVTSDFFPVLGVKPILGRVFAGKEDDIGAAPVVVVSQGFWTRKLGAAPDVVGRSLTLDGRDYTVVGVVPANVDFPAAGIRTCDVYVPIGQWANPLLTHRTAGLGIHGVGRLQPGVTVAQARADMDDVTRGLAAAYPDANKGIGATVVPFADALVGGVRPILLLLLGAVGFVLLIACVNVANLLLARSLARQREFAVRVALGASQARVVRQMLTESLVLAAAGGGLGLLAAAWGTRAALGSLPATLPRAEYVQVDVRVLLFTLGVSLLSGVVFGLLPALRTSSADLHETLKEGGRGASGTRHRTQAAFVVAELAMALVLLVGAGLMVRTLARLWDVDPGFRPDGVVTFGVKLAPSMAAKSPDAIRAALRDLHDRLAATPNVQAVSLQDGAVPLSDDDEELFWMDGQPKPSSPNDMNWALKYVVEPDYLQAMGLRLERGRFFSEGDREGSPYVVVIDDTLARKYFGGADPIGRRLNVDDYDAPAQIVGVVAHVKQWALDRDREQLQAQIYLPFMQMGDRAVASEASGVGVVLRAATEARPVRPAPADQRADEPGAGRLRPADDERDHRRLAERAAVLDDAVRRVRGARARPRRHRPLRRRVVPGGAADARDRRAARARRAARRRPAVGARPGRAHGARRRRDRAGGRARPGARDGAVVAALRRPRRRSADLRRRGAAPDRRRARRLLRAGAPRHARRSADRAPGGIVRALYTTPPYGVSGLSRTARRSA